MSKIYFEPWLGKNYRTSAFRGGPVLLLGWSHYERRSGWEASEPLGPQATKEIITAHIQDETEDTPRRFLAKVRQALTGGQLSVTREERYRFWHSVAFYNYIQEALQNAKEIPSDALHDDARPAFGELLRKHKPRTIIVVGERLWWKLPEDGHVGDRLRLPDNSEPFRHTWHYPTGPDTFGIASRIAHPSTRRGWDANRWHQWVSAALQHAANDGLCPKCLGS